VNLTNLRAAQVVLPLAPVEDLRRPLWLAQPALV
jgi:hypothetical protein